MYMNINVNLSSCLYHREQTHNDAQNQAPAYIRMWHTQHTNQKLFTRTRFFLYIYSVQTRIIMRRVEGLGGHSLQRCCCCCRGQLRI